MELWMNVGQFDRSKSLVKDRCHIRQPTHHTPIITLSDQDNESKSLNSYSLRPHIENRKLGQEQFVVRAVRKTVSASLSLSLEPPRYF